MTKPRTASHSDPECPGFHWASFFVSGLGTPPLSGFVFGFSTILLGLAALLLRAGRQEMRA